MTFDDVSAKPEQEFELHPDPTGTLEYSTKYIYCNFINDEYSDLILLAEL